MKKSTMGFEIETVDGKIRVFQDDHTIVISPEEVDILVGMLEDAKQELIPDGDKTTLAKYAKTLKTIANAKEISRLKRGH